MCFLFKWYQLYKPKRSSGLKKLHHPMVLGTVLHKPWHAMAKGQSSSFHRVGRRSFLSFFRFRLQYLGETKVQLVHCGPTSQDDLGCDQNGWWWFPWLQSVGFEVYSISGQTHGFSVPFPAAKVLFWKPNGWVALLRFKRLESIASWSGGQGYVHI